MHKTIRYFVKFFNDKAYAEDFVNGKVFANQLSYFKKLEESQNANRSDKYESVINWLQPGKVVVKLDGYTLTGLSSPISIQTNQFNHLNIFCLFADYISHFNELTANDIEAFNKPLQIPDACLKLGNYAVIIENPLKFLQRIKTAAKINDFDLFTGLVDYYDPITFHGNFPLEESIFKKIIDIAIKKNFVL